VAQKLWLDGSVIGEVKRRLMDADLIDADWQPLAWDKRQFRSDHDLTGAERQRRYREKQRNALRNAPVTPPDTDTDTDTEAEQKTHRPKTAARFRPPSVQEVAEYCAERRNGIDPEHFVAYYEATGWRTKGGTKLASWKSAVITWEKRHEADRKPGGNRRNNSHATLSRIAAEDDPEKLGGAAVSEIHGGLREAVDGEYRRH
jgi:hypothetical protein